MIFQQKLWKSEDNILTFLRCENGQGWETCQATILYLVKKNEAKIMIFQTKKILNKFNDSRPRQVYDTSTKGSFIHLFKSLLKVYCVAHTTVNAGATDKIVILMKLILE